MYFLHTFHPEAILFSYGLIQIHWYGLFVVLGILAGLKTVFFLAKKYQNLSKIYFISREEILDLALFLVLGGIIGARIYDVALEFPYYLNNFLAIFKIWQGGLAIHGALIGGLIGFWLFFKFKKPQINPWILLAIITPGMALGQAIGRFGNYFNQELFGLPTNLPWGIPIDIAKRPEQFISSAYFHPTFLYESIGSLIIFSILIYAHFWIIKKIKKTNKAQNYYFIFLIFIYLFFYSMLRFSLEFIRADYAPVALGLKAPQWVSLLIIFIVIIFSFKLKPKTNDFK